MASFFGQSSTLRDFAMVSRLLLTKLAVDPRFILASSAKLAVGPIPPHTNYVAGLLDFTLIGYIDIADLLSNQSHFWYQMVGACPTDIR